MNALNLLHGTAITVFQMLVKMAEHMTQNTSHASAPITKSLLEIDAFLLKLLALTEEFGTQQFMLANVLMELSLIIKNAIPSRSAQTEQLITP